MQFALSSDQRMIQDGARRLLADRIPLSRVRRLQDEETVDRPLLSELAAQGWFGLLAPESHGGVSVSGQAAVDAAALTEELGRGLYAGPLVNAWVAAAVLNWSLSEGHQGDLIPGCASGEALGVVCLAEPGRGWSSDLPSTRLSEAAGNLQLDGVKLWVEEAPSMAWFVVPADDGGELVLVVVPATAPGVSIRRVPSLDVTRRVYEVRFDAVRLGVSAIVSCIDPRAVLDSALDLSLALQCAESVGGAERVVEMTVDYAKQREQFGRPIGSFQVIKHKLADMFAQVQAARAITYLAALAVADGWPEAACLASSAKSYVGEAYSAITQQALQIHGGIGFTWEHDLGLYIRRAKASEAMLGDLSFHRERLLRESLAPGSA